MCSLTRSPDTSKHSCTHCPSQARTHSYTISLNKLLRYSPTRPIARSHTHTHTHTHSLSLTHTHTLTRALSQLTHSLTHSLASPFAIQMILGKGNPPFGIHPHAHLIAMTVVLEGEFEDEDTVAGRGPHTHPKGSLYMAQAGSGIEHLERTAREGELGIHARFIQSIRCVTFLSSSIKSSISKQSVTCLKVHVFVL